MLLCGKRNGLFSLNCKRNAESVGTSFYPLIAYYYQQANEIEFAVEYSDKAAIEF